VLIKGRALVIMGVIVIKKNVGALPITWYKCSAPDGPGPALHAV